jgi:hypothetical protein
MRPRELFGSRGLSTIDPSVLQIGGAMQIFLSWSGQRSHAVAEAFAEWLPTVMLGVKPWISSEDIEKGGTWITSIKDALHGSNGLGIFFATKEGIGSPWLLFEAGSIASLGHQRVCVVYVDIDASEVTPPLSLFQGTRLHKDDVLKLVRTLNKAMAEPMTEAVLNRTFERGWPDLDAAVQQAVARTERTGKRQPKKPSIDQVLGDVADSVQRIEARLSNLEAIARNGRPKEWMTQMFAKVADESGRPKDSLLDLHPEVLSLLKKGRLPSRELQEVINRFPPSAVTHGSSALEQLRLYSRLLEERQRREGGETGEQREDPEGDGGPPR